MVENFELNALIGSNIGILFCKDASIKFDRLSLDISLIGSLIPDSIMNNDKIKNAVANSGPKIKEFINTSFNKNVK